MPSYRGSDPRRRAKERAAYENRVAACELANRMAANNPSDVQQILWHHIADELDIPVTDVASAFRGGGHNGITFRVTPEAREQLARYQRD